MIFQGTRGIWEPDEGRYSAVALEMLRTGDWLHPQLNDARPHYTKPPVTYWALAASFRVLGVNEWAARLPNALAYTATAVGVFVLARRLVPGKELPAAVVYATSAGPFVAANVVSTDTLLACWETWAVAGFAVAWTSKSKRERQGGLLLMGVMFGLAFATKGPPGLLPLGGLLPAAVWTRGWRGLRQCFSIAGVAAFFVIGGGWFAAVCIDRPSLVHYFLADEVVARVASDEHKRNGEWYGWAWIYVPAILGGTLPWAHVWLAALWKRLRRGRAGALPTDDAGRLLALWIAVPLAVLCVAQSRMHLYVLPLLVPLALVVARQSPADLLRREDAAAGAGRVVRRAAGIQVRSRFRAQQQGHPRLRRRPAAGGGRGAVRRHPPALRPGVLRLRPGAGGHALPRHRRRRRAVHGHAGRGAAEGRPASSLLIVREAQLPEIEPLLAGMPWQRVGGRFDKDKVALRVGR